MFSASRSPSPPIVALLVYLICFKASKIIFLTCAVRKLMYFSRCQNVFHFGLILNFTSWGGLARCGSSL